MLKRLGFVNNIVELKKWIKQQEFKLKGETYYGHKTNRDEVWFGKGVKLGENNIYQSEPIDPYLQNIGDQWFGDGWNSLLLYRYRSGIGINRHKDRKCFKPRVVIINIGVADLLYGYQVYSLRDGEVIEFDNQIVHEVKPVHSERWSLSFRIVEGDNEPIRVKNGKRVGFVGEDKIYVGRKWRGLPESVLANPFKVGINGDLDQCVKQYRKWLWINVQEELKGGNKVVLDELIKIGKRVIQGEKIELICFCDGNCHGYQIKKCVEWLIRDHKYLFF